MPLFSKKLDDLDRIEFENRVRSGTLIKLCGIFRNSKRTLIHKNNLKEQSRQPVLAFAFEEARTLWINNRGGQFRLLRVIK